MYHCENHLSCSVWFSTYKCVLFRCNRVDHSDDRDIVYNEPDINIYIPSRVDRVQSGDAMCHGTDDNTHACVKGSYRVLNRTSIQTIICTCIVERWSRYRAVSNSSILIGRVSSIAWWIVTSTYGNKDWQQADTISFQTFSASIGLPWRDWSPRKAWQDLLRPDPEQGLCHTWSACRC